MWKSYELPTTAEIDGNVYKIQSDYRVILNIFKALNDPDLLDLEKIQVALNLFYPEIDKITNLQEAVNLLFIFINGNQPEEKNVKKEKPLMNWEQDMPLIIPPVNKILNTEIRSLEYLHWWTFLSAFMEIGDCTFSTFVSIRNKRNKGKKLENYEQEIYKENRSKIDIKKKYDSYTQSIMDEILGREV